MVSARIQISLRASVPTQRKSPKIDWDQLLKPEKKAKFELALRNKFGPLSDQVETHDVQNIYDKLLNSINEAATSELGQVGREQAVEYESERSKKLRRARDDARMDVERVLNTKAKAGTERRARAEQLRKAKAKWSALVNDYSVALNTDHCKHLEIQLDEMKKASEE